MDDISTQMTIVSIEQATRFNQKPLTDGRVAAGLPIALAVLRAMSTKEYEEYTYEVFQIALQRDYLD